MAAAVRPTGAAVRKSFLAVQCRFYSAPVDGSIPAAKQRFVPTEGTYPKGFLLGSAHAGVKASNTTRDDVAIVASKKPCVASGYFTRNRFAAAPVKLSKSILHHQQQGTAEGLRGVVINSGCANAVTGKVGLQDAVQMSRAVDRQFGDEITSKPWDGSSDPGMGSRTLVMSTGVIGQQLPIDKILSAIPAIKPKFGSSHDQWLGVAKAVMTTDTFPKLVSRQFTLPSHPSTTYTVSGFSKGAGMIHPNMATMLSVICTDAKITSQCLRDAGRFAVQRSFNSISIDGDTSTNDSLVVLANGAAAPDSAPGITEKASDDYKAFRDALNGVAVDLAKLVVRDGEGATKFVSIHVKAETSKLANEIGRTIAISPLVKTALYGKDANWGRILCAIGNVTPMVDFKVSHISVSFALPGTQGKERLWLVKEGQPVLPLDEALAKTVLDEEDVDIYVDLSRDEAERRKFQETTVWTCDFSHEYVTINGDYRT